MNDIHDRRLAIGYLAVKRKGLARYPVGVVKPSGSIFQVELHASADDFLISLLKYDVPYGDGSHLLAPELNGVGLQAYVAPLYRHIASGYNVSVLELLLGIGIDHNRPRWDRLLNRRLGGSLALRRRRLLRLAALHGHCRKKKK